MLAVELTSLILKWVSRKYVKLLLKMLLRKNLVQNHHEYIGMSDILPILNSLFLKLSELLQSYSIKKIY